MIIDNILGIGMRIKCDTCKNFNILKWISENSEKKIISKLKCIKKTLLFKKYMLTKCGYIIFNLFSKNKSF